MHHMRIGPAILDGSRLDCDVRCSGSCRGSHLKAVAEAAVASKLTSLPSESDCIYTFLEIDLNRGRSETQVFPHGPSTLLLFHLSHSITRPTTPSTTLLVTQYCILAHDTLSHYFIFYYFPGGTAVMASKATLTAPFHVAYSGSANLCTSAGLVWLDESDCSSPKSDHLIILSKDSQGSIGGLLTKPTPSSTETVTFTTTRKGQETATVRTTLAKPTAGATATITVVTTTTMAAETATVSPRDLDSSLLQQKPTLYRVTHTEDDGKPSVKTYTGAGTSLRPTRSLSTLAAVFLTLACLLPLGSAVPIESGTTSVLPIQKKITPPCTISGEDCLEDLSPSPVIAEQLLLQTRQNIEQNDITGTDGQSWFSTLKDVVATQGNDPRCWSTNNVCNTDKTRCTSYGESPTGQKLSVQADCDGKGNKTRCSLSLYGVAMSCDWTLDHCNFTDPLGARGRYDCDRNDWKCKAKYDDSSTSTHGMVPPALSLTAATMAPSFWMQNYIAQPAGLRRRSMYRAAQRCFSCLAVRIAPLDEG